MIYDLGFKMEEKKCAIATPPLRGWRSTNRRGRVIAASMTPRNDGLGLVEKIKSSISKGAMVNRAAARPDLDLVKRRAR